MRCKLMIILFFIVCLPLVNCTSYDYARRLVEQGNLLPESKLARLKLGMTREDVAILMGTSLESPTFNNDRWDYAYTLQRGNRVLKSNHVSLYFAKDRLIKIEK